MKKIILFLPLLFFSLTVHGENRINLSPLQPQAMAVELPRIRIPAEPTQQEMRLPDPLFAVVPSIVRPGEPVTIAFLGSLSLTGNTGTQAVLVDTRGRRLTRAPFFAFTQINATEQTGTAVGAEVFVAIMAVPSTAVNGLFTIIIEKDEEVLKELPLEVEFRSFYSETIALDARNTAIRTEPDPQRTREAEILWSILNRTGSDFYDGGPFIPPVTSTRRTSAFGSRRVYEYVTGATDTAIHAGVDYGVPTGTEVYASAGGRVVLARNRIVTGYSVILEHLPGVYSLYYHLNEIIVEEGAIVSSGEVLGHSGSTGLSTGPHLHWEIRISGENTCPDILIARAILDKDEILVNLKTYRN